MLRNLMTPTYARLESGFDKHLFIQAQVANIHRYAKVSFIIVLHNCAGQIIA